MLTRRFDRPAGGSDKNTRSPAQIILASTADFHIGSLQVQPSTLQTQLDESRTTLEPRVMQALVALATARGTVVSRDGLVDLCWSGRAVSEDAINRCIAKVRHIGSESRAFEIETIPRVGYRLVETLEAPGAVRKTTHRMVWWLLASTLLIVAVAGLLWSWRGAPDPTVPPIAVADFTALNSDPDAKLYAESVSTSVSSALVATGARLVSADRPIDSSEDARRAGAAILIKGTLRRQGDTIRITAAVESARNGATIVTRDFDAPASQAGSLPDQVAASLASLMWAWIAESRIESDPAVAEGFLRIVDSWGSPKSRSLARDLARAKPSSAAAQAVFAWTTGSSLSAIPPEQRTMAIADAREAAKRATAIRPEFGYILPCSLTPPGNLTADCDKALRRAVSADPEPPYASGYFGILLAQSGRLRESTGLMRSVLARSPFDPGRLSWTMFTLEMEHPADRENELPAIRDRARRYAPEAFKDEARYRSSVANGNFTAAEAMLDDSSMGEALLAGAGRDIVNNVFRAVRTRNPADAAAARSKCLPPPPEWNPPDFAFGTCLVGLTLLGDLDAAFTLAERGYADVECCSPADREKRWIDAGGLYYPRVELWGSAMAPFRADRRFIEIARRAGLLAYWKSGHPPDFCDFEQVPVCASLRSR